ncbi:MAG: PilZ domain-containing protein [Pseudomonadota bacterium]
MKWRSQRWVVDFPTKVSTDDTVNQLSILSISTTGARVFGTHGLEVGDRIRVSCLTDQISATVVWVKDESCGIKFARPIGVKQMSTFRKPGGTGTVAWSYVDKVSNGHGFREL